MAAESEDYLAVLKASYDYDPQGEDEVPMKEDQILFLLDRTDAESVLSIPTICYPCLPVSS
jgi:hypothetical protein